MSFAKIYSFIVSLISAQTLEPDNAIGPFAASSFWEPIGNFFVMLWNGINEGIYWVCKWLLALLDFLQYFIQKLIGLDYWLNNNVYTLKGATENDLLFSFLFNETVQKVFTAMVAIFFVLLIVFTIFAIIKQEWAFITKGEKDNSKTQILRNSIKAIALVLLFPIMLVMGIISSNAILASLVKALNIDMSTSFGATLFYIASKGGNKYRAYANGEKRSPVSDTVEFYITNNTKKRLVLTNRGSGSDSLCEYVSSYSAYVERLKTCTRYEVNSMFELVNPEDYKGDNKFTGYCAVLTVDGKGKAFLVKCSSDEASKTAMYYYLKNVLQVKIMNSNNDCGMPTLKAQIGKFQYGSTPGFITSLELAERPKGELITAAYNTWTYAGLYTKSQEFERSQSYIVERNADTNSFLYKLGLTGITNAKLMYNDDSISSYFDGGQLGFVSRQAEYLVMADVVDFIQKNNFRLYMMDATSSMINWGYQDNNYHVDTKWVGTTTTIDNRTVINDVYLGSSNAGSVYPFVVSYSEDCNETDFGNQLYLAQKNVNNELYGSVYIMCIKIVVNGVEQYIPLVNGKTYIDPVTKTPYQFRSSYYTSDYKGVVIAKGTFDTEGSAGRGNPTYLQNSVSFGNKKVNETEPYYFDVEQYGGMEQYATMLQNSNFNTIKNSTTTDRYELENFEFTYGDSAYTIQKFEDTTNAENKKYYYKIANANGDEITDIAFMQTIDREWFDNVVKDNMKVNISYRTGGAFEPCQLTCLGLNGIKSSVNERYYWFEDSFHMGCYVVVNFDEGTIVLKDINDKQLEFVSEGEQVHATSKIEFTLSDEINSVLNYNATTGQIEIGYLNDDEIFVKHENPYAIIFENPDYQNDYYNFLSTVVNNLSINIEVDTGVVQTATYDHVAANWNADVEDGIIYTAYSTDVDTAAGEIKHYYKLKFDFVNNEITVYNEVDGTTGVVTEDDTRVSPSKIKNHSFKTYWEGASVGNTYDDFFFRDDYKTTIKNGIISIAYANGSKIKNWGYMLQQGNLFYEPEFRDTLSKYILGTQALFNGEDYADPEALKVDIGWGEDIGSGTVSGVEYDRYAIKNQADKVMFHLSVFDNGTLKLDVKRESFIDGHSFQTETKALAVQSYDYSTKILTLSGRTSIVWTTGNVIEFAYERNFTGTDGSAGKWKYNVANTWDLNNDGVLESTERIENVYHFQVCDSNAPDDFSSIATYSQFAAMKPVETDGDYSAFVKELLQNLSTAFRNDANEKIVVAGKKDENTDWTLAKNDVASVTQTRAVGDSRLFYNFNIKNNTIYIQAQENEEADSTRYALNSYVTETRSITSTNKYSFIMDYRLDGLAFASSNFSNYSINEVKNSFDQKLYKYEILNDGLQASINDALMQDIRINLTNLSSNSSETALYTGVYKSMGDGSGTKSYLYMTDYGYYFILQSNSNKLGSYFTIRSMNNDGTYGKLTTDTIRTYTEQYSLYYDYSDQTTQFDQPYKISDLKVMNLEFAYFDDITTKAGQRGTYAVYKTASAEPLEAIGKTQYIYMYIGHYNGEKYNTLTIMDKTGGASGEEYALNFVKPIDNDKTNFADKTCFSSSFLRFNLYDYFSVYVEGYDLNGDVAIDGDDHEGILDVKINNSDIIFTEAPKPNINDAKFVFDCKVNSQGFYWDPRVNSLGLYDGNEYKATIYKNIGVECDDLNRIDEVAVRVLYNDNDYYNIKTQNTFETIDAARDHYNEIKDSLVVACYRDNIYHQWHGDSNFWTFSSFRIKLEMNVRMLERQRVSTAFYLSEGIVFDYFFEGHIGFATFFTPASFFPGGFLILLISSALMIKILMTSIWGVIKRFYEITLYFIAMPAMASTIPLDGGSRFTQSIQTPLIAKVLGTYGIILGLNVFFILLAPIESMSNIFTAEDVATSGSYFLKHFPFSIDVLNLYVYILFMLVAFTMINELPTMITNIMGGDMKLGDVKESGKNTAGNIKNDLKSAGSLISGQGAISGVKSVVSSAGQMIPGGALVTGAFKAGKGVVDWAKDKAKAKQDASQAGGPGNGGGPTSERNDDDTEEPQKPEKPEIELENKETTDPNTTQVTDAIRDQTGLDPTQVAQTGSEVQSAIVEAAAVEASDGVQSEGEQEAHAQRQFNANATGNSSILNGDEAAQHSAVANTVRNDARNGGAAGMNVAVQAATDAKDGSLSKQALIQLIRDALGGLSGLTDDQVLQNYGVEARQDKDGKTYLAVMDGLNNQVGKADQSQQETFINSVMSDTETTDDALVAATEKSGQNNAINGMLGSNLVNGIDLSGLADPETATDPLTEQVFQAAMANDDVRNDAIFRQLLDSGKINELISAYHVKGADGQDINLAADFAAWQAKPGNAGKTMQDYFDVDARYQEWIKAGNKGDMAAFLAADPDAKRVSENRGILLDQISKLGQSNDENIVTSMKEEEYRGQIGKAIQATGFQVSAWELEGMIDPDGRQEFQDRAIADRESLRNHTILDNATGAEKTTILANTARNIIKDDPNGKIAQTLQETALASTMSDAALGAIDPAVLEKLTGKKDVKELTTKDKAFLAFMQQQGVTDFSKVDDLSLMKFQADFKNGEKRQSVVDAAGLMKDDAAVQKFVEDSGYTTLFARAATIDSRLALTETQIQNNPGLTNDQYAQMANQNYQKHHARTAGEAAVEAEMSREAVLAGGNEGLYDAFINSDIENKGTIINDGLLKTVHGLDKTDPNYEANLQAKTAAVLASAGLTQDQIDKLKAQGYSDEDLLVAYTKADKLGEKVDASVLDTYLRMGQDEEMSEKLDKKVLTEMKTQPEFQQLTDYIMDEKLTTDQKNGLADDVAATGLKGFDPKAQERILARLGGEDGEIKTDFMAWKAQAGNENKTMQDYLNIEQRFRDWQAQPGNAGKTMQDFLAADAGAKKAAEQRERLENRAGEMSFYELTQIKKGKTSDEVFSEINAEANRRAYIEQRLRTEGDTITSSDVRDQLLIESEGGTSANVTEFADKIAGEINLVGKQDEESIRKKASREKMASLLGIDGSLDDAATRAKLAAKLGVADKDIESALDGQIDSYVEKNGESAAFVFSQAGDEAVLKENKRRIASGMGERQRMMLDEMRSRGGLMKEARALFVKEFEGADFDSADLATQNKFLMEHFGDQISAKDQQRIDAAFMAKIGITDTAVAGLGLKDSKGKAITSMEDLSKHAQKTGVSLESLLQETGLVKDVAEDEIDAAILKNTSPEEFDAVYGKVERGEYGEKSDLITGIKRNFISRKVGEQTDIGLDEYANSHFTPEQKKEMMFNQMAEAGDYRDSKGKRLEWKDLTPAQRKMFGVDKNGNPKKIEDLDEEEIRIGFEKVAAAAGYTSQDGSADIETAVNELINGKTTKRNKMVQDAVGGTAGATSIMGASFVDEKQVAKLYAKQNGGADFSKLSPEEQALYVMQNFDTLTAGLKGKKKQAAVEEYAKLIMGGNDFTTAGAQTQEGHKIANSADLIKYAQSKGISISEALQTMKFDQSAAGAAAAEAGVKRIKTAQNVAKVDEIKTQIAIEEAEAEKDTYMSETSTATTIDTIKSNPAFLKRAKKIYEKENPGKKFDINDLETIKWLREDANFNKIYNTGYNKKGEKKNKLRKFDSSYLKKTLGIRNDADFAALQIDNGKGGTFRTMQEFLDDAEERGITVREAIDTATSGGKKFSKPELDRLKNLRMARRGKGATETENQALITAANADKKAMTYIQNKAKKEGLNWATMSKEEQDRYTVENYNNYLNGVGVKGWFKGKRVKKANEAYIEHLLGGSDVKSFGVRKKNGKVYTKASQLIKVAKKRGISLEELLLETSENNEQNQGILDERRSTTKKTHTTDVDRRTSRIRELAGMGGKSVGEIRANIYKTHFKRNPVGVAQAVTGDSALPDLERMTPQQRKDFNFNRNLIQSRLRNNGNSTILANVFKNTTTLNDDKLVAEMAMLQTGKKDFGLETKVDVLRNNAEFMAKVVAASGGATKGAAFEANLRKMAASATSAEVKAGLTPQTVNKYLNSHEAVKDQLVSLGAKNIMLTLDKSTQDQKNLAAAMQNTSTQNQVVRQLLTNEFANKDDIKDLIKQMLLSQKDKTFTGLATDKDKDDYIEANFDKLMTKLARNRYLQTDAAGQVSINNIAVNNTDAYSVVNQLMSSNKGFERVVRKNATSAVAPGSHASEAEKDQFFRSTEIANDATRHKTAGAGSQYGNVHEAFDAFTKDNAFVRGWYKVRRKLPETSASYDNWNRILENKINEIKNGTGIYATYSIEKRKEEIEILKSQKIHYKKPEYYGKLSPDEQREFDRQQEIYKKEAFKTGNFSKVYKKGMKKKMKAAGPKTLVNEFGTEFGYEVTRSEKRKVKHQENLNDINSKITRYNATSSIRNKELEFGSHFESFAGSYLDPKQFKTMMKTYGLVTDAEYAKLNDKAKAAERVKRQKAFEGKLAEIRKVASKKVAKDNGVHPKSFLDQRGIGETVVRYKNGTKKFTEVKSSTATSAKNQKKGKFNKDSVEYAIQAENDAISLRKKMDSIDELVRDKNKPATRAEIEKILGPEMFNKFVATYKWKGGINKMFDGSGNIRSRSIFFRDLNSFMGDRQRQVDKHMSNPRSPYYSATKDAASHFIGKTLGGAKSAYDLDRAQERANNYNAALNMISGQKDAVTFNSLYGRLHPQIKTELAKELHKIMSSTATDLQKKNQLESLIAARLHSANQRVSNNQFLKSDKSKLMKLNGTWVDRNDVSRTKVSDTMTGALNTSGSGVYQNLVKAYNAANARYKAEQENFDNLARTLKQLQEGPWSPRKKARIEQVTQAMNASRIKLGTLQSIVNSAEARKVTYEKQFAANEVVKHRQATATHLKNTLPAEDIFDRYQVRRRGSGEVIDPKSIDAKKFQHWFRHMFLPTNKHMWDQINYSMRNSEKALRDYIAGIQRKLNDDYKKNRNAIKDVRSKLESRLRELDLEGKESTRLLRENIKRNIQLLRDADLRFDAELLEMGYEISETRQSQKTRQGSKK